MDLLRPFTLDLFNPDVWVPNWGNGLREASEECDDSNYLSGDGCSHKCKVEKGWVCTGGSLTSKDTCTRTIAAPTVKLEEPVLDFEKIYLEFSTDMKNDDISK